MTTVFKPLPPPVGSGDVGFIWQYLSRVYDVVRGILAGKLNCTATVTLRASQTTTTLTDARIGPESWIGLAPLTANASTAEKAGVYVSARAQGSATLTHASSANTGQDFAVTILG
ncbi:hypothetical protein [Hypericibacter sp.]|uniref:hypothetical protein n=1 Tax=Hypericibacter sp. TaxID=2705401 RepID=UPI003D6D255C